jgi:AcrR family transcriptional regulator
MTGADVSAPVVGLREQKKRQTRQALLDAAERLFEAHGYDRVTVAQIADAANISVKMLFTYFASKEDLAFGDEARLRDALVSAIAARPTGAVCPSWPSPSSSRSPWRSSRPPRR